MLMASRDTGVGFPQVKKGARRSKRDWQFWAMVAGAVVCLMLLAVPLVLAGRMTYRFQGFKQDLAQSFASGERKGTVTLTSAEGTRQVTDAQCHAFFSTIERAGMGKPTEVVPTSQGLTLEFGDGSTLDLWEVEIVGAGGADGTGVLVRYQRADGEVYAYDTDQMQLDDCIRALGGA